LYSLEGEGKKEKRFVLRKVDDDLDGEVGWEKRERREGKGADLCCFAEKGFWRG